MYEDRMNTNLKKLKKVKKYLKKILNINAYH